MAEFEGSSGALDTGTTLLSMPADVMACITGKLSQQTTRSLAATSSTALVAVLETYPQLRSFRVEAAIMRCMARLTFSAERQPRALATLICCLFPDNASGTCNVHVPLHIMRTICAEHLAAARDPTSAVQLPHSALGAVVRLDSPSKLEALPAGMHALHEITLRRGGILGAKAAWLPISSAACVRILHAPGSKLRCIPLGLPLVDLDVSKCRALEPDWCALLLCSTCHSANMADFRCPAEWNIACSAV